MQPGGGTLFVIATPIGNLGDVTARVPVLLKRALYPVPVLKLPVLPKSAAFPSAVFCLPVVLASKANSPVAVFSDARGVEHHGLPSGSGVVEAGGVGLQSKISGCGVVDARGVALKGAPSDSRVQRSGVHPQRVFSDASIFSSR